MTTYFMAAIATLNAKLGQRCGVVWRGGGCVGLSGVMLPTVAARGGDGVVGGDNSVVDYIRV